MMEHSALRATITTALGRSRGVALMGPGQSGKTTLARFLILGSASPDLLTQTSESLAGRVERIGVEINRMDAPALTPSMRIAFDDLRLGQLVVLYPGSRRYALAEGVEVVPFAEYCAG